MENKFICEICGNPYPFEMLSEKDGTIMCEHCSKTNIKREDTDDEQQGNNPDRSNDL